MQNLHDKTNSYVKIHGGASTFIMLCLEISNIIGCQDSSLVTQRCERRNGRVIHTISLHITVDIPLPLHTIL